MTKHPEGRKLLHIEWPEVHEIKKNLIRRHEYVREGKKWRRFTTTEFRIGAKYANLIRFQWDWFCVLAAEYNAEMSSVGVRSFGFGLVPGLAFTTTTVYPDPDPETTTVDGTCGWSGSDTAFATVRAHVGNATNPNDAAASANDNVNNYLCRLLNGAVDFNQLRQMNRACYLFDTSSIPDTDSISSAIFSIAGNTGPTINQVNGTVNTVRLDKCNPASNTAIAATDFDITKWDTVAQSDTTLSYSSWPADDAYADFALNATGIGNISKTGVTKLGLRDSIDFLNTGLSGNGGTVQDGGNCDFADTAGTSTDPKLVIVHSAVATVFSNLLLMGAG